MASLEEIGVKPIEAVGQTFDPDSHNAVMHEESDEHEENTISEELQKGYIYRDHVVRYSMVKESPSCECNSVCHGKRLQMESIAEILWELAYGLCTHEPLEQE